MTLEESAKPFMHWHGNPCWVSPYAPDNIIVTVPRAWMGGWKYGEPPGVHVSATFATWSLLFAHAIANAYRPDALATMHTALAKGDV